MRIDLFEFLEGIFRGLVYFFYNAVETLWILTLHPWRGGLWLYRAYSQKDRQQIGGLTFLFLIFFIFFGLFAQAASDKGVDFRGMLGKPLRLDSDEAWRTVLSAATSTVLLDSIARLYFRARVPDSLRRRKQLLATFEYSLTWPALLLVLLPFAGLLQFQAAEAFDGLWILFLSAPAAALLCFIAASPAALALRVHPHPWKRRPDLTWPQRIGKIAARLGIQFGIMLLVLGATVAGAAVMITFAGAGSPTSNFLRPVALRCWVEPGRLRVQVALHNPNDAPILLNPGADTALTVMASDEGGYVDNGRLRSLDGGDAPPVLVQPRQGVVLDLAGDVAVGRLSPGNVCGLSAFMSTGLTIAEYPKQPIDFDRVR